MGSSKKSLTIAVDINPATRPVVTGTETFTREVSRRLPAAAPDLVWRFLASRPKPGLGVDVTVLPFRRLWSQVRLPIALAADRPDLLFVPGHVVPFAYAGRSVNPVKLSARSRPLNVSEDAGRRPEAKKTGVRPSLWCSRPAASECARRTPKSITLSAMTESRLRWLVVTT